MRMRNEEIPNDRWDLGISRYARKQNTQRKDFLLATFCFPSYFSTMDQLFVQVEKPCF